MPWAQHWAGGTRPGQPQPYQCLKADLPPRTPPPQGPHQAQGSPSLGTLGDLRPTGQPLPCHPRAVHAPMGEGRCARQRDRGSVGLKGPRRSNRAQWKAPRVGTPVEGGHVPVYHGGCQAGARLAMAHSPPSPRPPPPMLSRDGGDGGWGGGLGMEGQAGVQPRPPAGCDGGQAGPVGGSFPAPQDRQTERAGAGLVMVLRVAGWAGRGQDVAWPPLGPYVPGAGHGGCPPPGSSAGDNVGCPERAGRHPLLPWGQPLTRSGHGQYG